MLEYPSPGLTTLGVPKPQVRVPPPGDDLESPPPLRMDLPGGQLALGFELVGGETLMTESIYLSWSK